MGVQGMRSKAWSGRCMAPSCTSLTTSLWHLPKRHQQHHSHATTDCLDAASYNNLQRLPVSKAVSKTIALHRLRLQRQAVRPGGPLRHELPPAEAPALFADLPFHQHGSHVAPCCPDLKDSRVQEVQKHLQSCIPQLPQLDLLRERRLSSRGRCSSVVNLDLVVVRQGIVDAGGCGMISL